MVPVLILASALAASPIQTVRHLAFEIGPRPAGTESETIAAAWLAQELRAAGFDVAIETFAIPGGVSRNVIGRNGPGPWHLFGAHYDTKRRAPGADDNASGCAAILELARLTPWTGGNPRMIVFFGAEEKQTPRFEDHHFGSRDFVARHGDEIIDATIVDMVGLGPMLRVRSMRRTAFADRCLAAVRSVNPAASWTPDPRGYGDHESFEERGIPAVWLERRPSPYYHSPLDRVVREDYLDEDVRILCHSSTLPLWEVEGLEGKTKVAKWKNDTARIERGFFPGEGGNPSRSAAR